MDLDLDLDVQDQASRSELARLFVYLCKHCDSFPPEIFKIYTKLEARLIPGDTRDIDPVSPIVVDVSFFFTCPYMSPAPTAAKFVVGHQR